MHPIELADKDLVFIKYFNRTIVTLVPTLFVASCPYSPSFSSAVETIFGPDLRHDYS